MTHLRQRTRKITCAIKNYVLFQAVLISVILYVLMGLTPVFAEVEFSFKCGPPSSLWHVRTWGKSFGGEENEESSSMAVTADGGCVLAGSTYSFPSISEYEDAWVMKLGPEGSVEWENSYGNVFWDSIHSIQQTHDGGYIATGTHYPPDGSQQVWVLKLTPHGEIDWQFTYGRDDHYDSAWSIQQTSDGGYIICGGTQAHAIGGEQGAWVLKLSDSGAVEWQKFLGGAEYDYLFSVEQTSDGGYVLAGGTYSYAQVPYFSDVWLVKMFPNGDIDWARTFGGDYDDVAYSVKQACDGGYVLTCWTSFGSGDVLIIKTDPQGNLDWQKRYGGEKGDVPTSMKLTLGGGILISGYTESYGFGGYDGWIFKLGRDGTMKWQMAIGGAQNDVFNEIVTMPFGFIATGYTESFGAGRNDFWCIQITPFGRGAGVLKSISMSSDAVLQPMEVTENDIAVYSEETQVTPGTAQATSFPTSSYQADLAKTSLHVEGTINRPLVTQPGDAIPWPIQAKSYREN